MTDEALKRALIRYFTPWNCGGPHGREKDRLQSEILDALEVREWQFETAYWDYFVDKAGEIQCALPLGAE